MAIRNDWLKRPLAELYTMFNNVDMKIDNYKMAYDLSDAWIERIKTICKTFKSAYTGVMQSRAAVRDLNEWFDNVLYGEPQGESAPAPPAIPATTVPVDAFIGIMDEFREMMNFFKANAAYTVAAGDNLMIVAPAAEEVNPDDATPALEASVEGSGEVKVVYTRGEFSGLELQWRKAGETVWQAADKSTETVILFEPENVTAPANIEVRGIYLLKNRRVGNWSPVYSVTIS